MAAPLPPAETRFRGYPVAPGIGIGPVREAVEPELTFSRRQIAAADVDRELERLDEAVAASRKQLAQLKARLANMPEQSQSELSPLIDAYAQMLGGSRLMRGIRARIAEQLSCPESAVVEEAEAQASAILALTGSDRQGRLRRAEEVREIGRRLLRSLTHQPFRSFTDLPPGTILAAASLRPADAALIRPENFIGIITDEGGPDSHTAVMLRALGLPVVLGATGVLDALQPDSVAVVDGDVGEIILNPTAATLTEIHARADRAAQDRRLLSKLRHLPAETTDRVGVELQANLELPFELPIVARSGAVGIGLLRSEFMFMNRSALPDEAVQALIYREIIEAMAGATVTIRVLDWGSDKEVEALNPYLPVRDEANPALGLRGIRLLLRQPALLETQFAAIFRAAAVGPVRVMLPMVSTAYELIAAREIYDRVWRRLKRRNIALPAHPPPLGIMIETPASALAAPQLSRLAEFFAIGTNDLTMYTLAADRGLAASHKLYDPLEPAILRLIEMTATAGRAAQIPVSLCGELASRAVAAPLLIGLGIRQLSMHGNAIPSVKRAIRAVSLAQCQALATAALDALDATAVAKLIAET